MGKPCEILRLGLELRIGAEPLTGRLLGPGEDERDFTGWVDFIAVVQSLQGSFGRVERDAPSRSTIKGGRS